MKLSPRDIIQSDGDTDLESLRDEFIRNGQFRKEVFVTTRKGRVIPVEINARLTEDARGRKFAVSVVRDITRRKEIQTRLRESEELYRAHFENIHDVIFSMDADFLITSVSPSVEKFLGYVPDDFIGKYFHHCLNVIHPDYRSRAVHNTARLLAGENEKVLPPAAPIGIRYTHLHLPKIILEIY